jgi:anti-sigma B factor antagonist
MNAPSSRLAIHENMTIYLAEQQKHQLLDALLATQHLELDLSAVTEIDTAGLQLLMLVKREAVQHNKRVTISGHSPAVRQTLDFCNLAGTFGDPMLIPANR